MITAAAGAPPPNGSNFSSLRIPVYITGLAARKLAANPRILDAARDQARSDQILVMATDAARTVGLPARYEGHGVLTR